MIAIVPVGGTPDPTVIVFGKVVVVIHPFVLVEVMVMLKLPDELYVTGTGPAPAYDAGEPPGKVHETPPVALVEVDV